MTIDPAAVQLPPCQSITIALPVSEMPPKAQSGEPSA
jgi:hypothetical protein